MGPIIPSPHAPQPSALAKLSLRDKLLLAQAVHEIGTTPPDWGRVSALLLAHPLIRQQSRLEQAANAGLTLGRIFGTRECERAWTALMRQRGLVLSKEESDRTPVEAPSGAQPQVPLPKPKEARGLQPRMDRRSQLALAQLLYAERMEELKEQIKEKEQQFKSLVKEIDEIKSGQADARIEMELRIEMENLAKGPPLPPSTPGGTVTTAGQTTPGGTTVTPTKASKVKGRARGESSATTPGGDLTKMSPRSDGTGSGPNSASKKTDSAKSKKVGDRRQSTSSEAGALGSPTKLVSGPPTSLPSTPSITLPASITSTSAATPGPATAPPSAQPDGSTAALPSAVTAASSSGSTTKDPASTSADSTATMTTEEAEQAVASAATEAAVKAIQNPSAAAESASLEAAVQSAAEKVVDAETNLELAARAEGDAEATTEVSSAAKAKANGAESEVGGEDSGSQPAASSIVPAADVVIKEKDPAPPSADVPAADAASTTQAQRDAGTSQRPDSPKEAPDATEPTATSAKRKRDDEIEAPSTSDATAEADRLESPTKKSRTAESDNVVEDVVMDSEDEAEAAVGAKPAVDKESRTPVSNQAKEASKSEQDNAREDEEEEEEEEAEDQIKSVQPPRRRGPSKLDEASAPDDKAPAAQIGEGEKGKESRVAKKDTEQDEGTKEEEEDDAEEEEDEEEEGDTKSNQRAASRSTPVRNRYGSSSSRLRRGSSAREDPSQSTPPSSERERAAKRKLVQVLTMLLTEVSNHTHGNLFHAPIKEQDAPDYYQLIKQPMDIKSIKSRIKEGSIASATQLRKALNLMFANSLIYNRPGTEVHRMATEMSAASEAIFARYEATQRF